MKNRYTLLFLTSLSFALLSCDPLDQKYDPKKAATILAEHTDLENRSALIRATVSNDLRAIPNEDFSYRELIDQGKVLETK
ncbi:hypothetical protein GCM10027347_11580 [Larkinella harenae]